MSLTPMRSMLDARRALHSTRVYSSRVASTRLGWQRRLGSNQTQRSEHCTSGTRSPSPSPSPSLLIAAWTGAHRSHEAAAPAEAHQSNCKSGPARLKRRKLLTRRDATRLASWCSRESQRMSMSTSTRCCLGLYARVFPPHPQSTQGRAAERRRAESRRKHRWDGDGTGAHACSAGGGNAVVNSPLVQAQRGALRGLVRRLFS